MEQQLVKYGIKGSEGQVTCPLEAWYLPLRPIFEWRILFSYLFCINYLGLAKLNYVEVYFKLLNKLHQWGLLLMPQQNQQQQNQQQQNQQQQMQQAVHSVQQ